MNEAVAHHRKILHPHRVFTLFKWTVYLLLAWNTWQFLQEDLLSSTAMFEGRVTLDNFIQVFSASIDTAAWLVLLLVFEFETAIIPDELLRGWLNFALTSVKVVCYLFIVYAFYGYLSEFLMLSKTMPFITADLCSLVDSGWNYVVSLDDYPALDSVSCVSLQGQSLLQVAGTELIGTRESMALAWRLALVDVVNAGTWLVIVAMLEVEVWMQLKDVLTTQLMRWGKFIKAIVYGVLFICAIYWGIDGDFLDFWDAFLWLVAFIFIELNIFQWHEEAESDPDIPAASD